MNLKWQMLESWLRTALCCSSWLTAAWLATKIPSPDCPTRSLPFTSHQCCVLRAFLQHADVIIAMNINHLRATMSLAPEPLKLQHGLPSSIRWFWIASYNKPPLRSTSLMRSMLVMLSAVLRAVSLGDLPSAADRVEWQRSQAQLRQFMCDHKELKHLNQLANLVIYLQMMTHLFELNKLQHWTQSSTRQKLIADINGFKWILRFASCSGPCMSILDIQPQQQCRESCDVRGQSRKSSEPLDLWPVTLVVNRSGRNVPSL